jgi:hypothetical protein
MKNKKSIIHLIEVACACLILLGPGLIFAGEKSGGHVIVNRVANFGTDLSLSVSVDGSEVANLVEGRSYDGYLPPGKHVISAVVSPNREDSERHHQCDSRGDLFFYCGVAGTGPRFGKQRVRSYFS